MDQQLRLLHFSQKDLQEMHTLPGFAESVFAGEFERQKNHFFSWKTCLREIYFLPVDFHIEALAAAYNQLGTANNFKAFLKSGIEAHQFLLQVVCGLHSPMKGETEVMGQFKKLLSILSQSELASHYFGLEDLLKMVHDDAKLVRQKHLTDLGCQSYGSLVRKSLKKVSQQVDMVGTGQLANEILPWLVKDHQLVLFSRNSSVKKQAPVLSEALKNPPRYANLQSRPQGKILVIAAPISNQDLAIWMQQHRFEKIFDLRGEQSAKNHNLESACENYVGLSDVFAELEMSQRLGLEKTTAANQLIEKLVSERSTSSRYRPFGWDDVCA